jgi:hypothetical protein
MCPEWDTFKKFSEDMGVPPEGKTSLCIKPRCKVFKKENCYWGTHSELLGYTDYRKNKVTYKGSTLTITAWAEKRGMSFACLYQRLANGWPIEEALGYVPRRRA